MSRGQGSLQAGGRAQERCATMHGEFQADSHLTSDAESVAQLRLAAPELSIHLGDGASLNATCRGGSVREMVQGQ
jgi:hypothetical protein